MKLCDGHVSIKPDDALHVVLGYIFGRTEERLGFRSPATRYPSPGDDRDVHTYKWAYHTFDCAAPSEGPRLTVHDVLIANALNAPLGHRALAAAMEVSGGLSDLIGEIEQGATFGELDLPTVICRYRRAARCARTPSAPPEPRLHA